MRRSRVLATAKTTAGVMAFYFIVGGLSKELGVSFLLLATLTILLLYFAHRMTRFLVARQEMANAARKEQAQAEENRRVRELAFEVADEDFENAVKNFQRGVALIRPYPPHTRPSGRSRIGGWPDLPKGIAWPRVDSNQEKAVDRGGSPLHFIAQIDLSEIPPVCKDLPKIGTLLFFALLDEELGWSGSTTCIRIIYDKNSSGKKTPPPKAISAIFDHGGYYDEDFGIAGEQKQTTLFEWPLIATAVDTLPATRIDFLDARRPYFIERRNVLETKYMLAQLQDVPTRKAADLRDASTFGWTNFPCGKLGDGPTPKAWAEALQAPRTRELLVRRMANMLSDDANYHSRRAAEFKKARRPEKSEEHLRMAEIARNLQKLGLELLTGKSAGNADAIPGIERLALWLDSVRKSEGSRCDFAKALQDSMVQFACESGHEVAVLHQVHESVWDIAAPAHVLRRADWGMSSSSDTDCVAHYHQMLGHIRTAQGPASEQEGDICLLHLRSDYGLKLLICDVGDMQFWVKRSDLREEDFSKVWGTTQGY